MSMPSMPMPSMTMPGMAGVGLGRGWTCVFQLFAAGQGAPTAAPAQVHGQTPQAGSARAEPPWQPHGSSFGQAASLSLAWNRVWICATGLLVPFFEP